MAFIPVPNVAAVELVYSQSGQITENTLYFSGSTDWTANNMLTLATQVRDWWITNLRPLTGQNTTLINVRVRSLAAFNSPGIELVVSTNNTGSSAGSNLPNNATVATTFITALRGRSFRGRNFFAGLTSAQLATPVTLLPAAAAAIQAAYALLFSTVTINTAQHVVVSRYTNKAARSEGVATPVTGYRTEGNVDSQRRRLVGRGS